jgi:HEAT repeat protein
MTRLIRPALAACVLAGLFLSPAARAFDEDSLIKDHAKTLAKDKDPKERASAAHWLGGRKQPAAVAALAAALSDPDSTVREAAASALWDTGKDAAAAKPELQKTLADKDAAVVARAAGALAAMDVPDAELADAWRRALDGARDDATAFLAARGLIGFDPPDKLAPPILTWIAKNADRGAHPPKGVSATDYRDSAEHGAKALEHLLRKDAEPILPLLDKTVRRTPESGKYVLGALAHVQKLPPGAVDLALAHTHSEDDDTRAAAIALAGKAASEKDVAKWMPEAVRLLGDHEEGVRSASVWAIRGVKGLGHDAAPELARLVASTRESSRLRESAAEALEEVGNQANPIAKADKIAVANAAKAALAVAMKDKDHDVAPAAVSAYNVLYVDTAEAVAALADAAVSGADAAARSKALQCLRNRQGQAKGVVDQLRPLTQNADKSLADDAKTAIEWIERGGAGSPGVIKGGTGAEGASEASTSTTGHPEPETSHPERSEGSRATKAADAGSTPANEAAGLAALRERKLDFDEPSFNRALMTADGDAVRAYLDAGMSANHVFADENRRTPLMILFFGRQACAQGAEGRAIVSLLIQRGANVNAQDEKQNTPLMFAADNCDRETLRMLLKAGAKLNTKNWAGLTALSMGIVSGNPGLEELIAAGARLDAQTAKAYADAYKGNPKALALVKKASQP